MQQLHAFPAARQGGDGAERAGDVNYLADNGKPRPAGLAAGRRVRVDLFKPHSGEWLASGAASVSPPPAGADLFVEILATQDAAPAAAFEHFDVVVSPLVGGPPSSAGGPVLFALYRQETFAARWATALTALDVPRFSGPGGTLLAMAAELRESPACEAPRMGQG